MKRRSFLARLPAILAIPFVARLPTKPLPLPGRTEFHPDPAHDHPRTPLLE
jgi:hypothetical protein